MKIWEGLPDRFPHPVWIIGVVALVGAGVAWLIESDELWFWSTLPLVTFIVCGALLILLGGVGWLVTGVQRMRSSRRK